MRQTSLTRSALALNAEWQRWADEQPPASWFAPTGEANPPRNLAAVLDRIRSAPDATLRLLLERQAAGDTLAGRTIVQALLPKLILMAARDPRATLDDYVASLWIRLATYPLARRPERIAANLTLDTLKSVKATQRPPACAGLPVVEADPLADASRVLDAGQRLGVLDPITRRTLHVVYVDGRTSAAAGAILGVSADAVRWRCSRGVRALRAIAEDLADDLIGCSP